MTTNQNLIRVILADDHPVTLAGIRAMLSEAHDIQIVGEAQDGLEAQQLTAQLRPHVLLLDLRMPGPRPAEVERWVRAHCPETVTLILTAHDRNAYLAEMIDAGAAGYLLKGVTAQRLIDAIRRAVRGDWLFDPEQLDRARRWRTEAGNKLRSLSKRERQVLKLLVQGLNNDAIATALNVTSKTAAFHVANILEKLGVASRQAAIAWVHTYVPEDMLQQLDSETGNFTSDKPPKET